VVRWGSFFHDYWYSFKSNLVEFPIHIIVVYLNVYFLIPKFVLNKKYWSYISYLFLGLFLVYIFRTGLNYLLVTKEIWPEAEQAGTFLEPNHVIAVVLGELYVIAFVTAIKLLIDWTIEIRKNQELAKLQLHTELKLLRAQIQPHFFFNTLNSLYALTLKKSDDAPHLVIKLSEMMHYILYEVKSSKVNLLDEINHINNYIEIEEIRFKNRIISDLNISGNIENIQVPPLLFLSFVENSFKHGLKNNDILSMSISFNTIHNKYLEFNLKNTFNPDVKKAQKHGIGIINTKRRLKLLFNKDYKLKTKIKDNTYILYLKIPIR